MLRVVVKNGFSRDLADLFLTHLRSQLRHLTEAGGMPTPLPAAVRTPFHH